MNNKLQEIYNGWKNLLIPDEEIKPYIEKVAKARIDICDTCEFDSSQATTLSVVDRLRFDRHCTKCGCTLSAKTRSLTSSCPLKKWGPEVKET